MIIKGVSDAERTPRPESGGRTHSADMPWFLIGRHRKSAAIHPMLKVLLVEDEPAIADTLIYALETECFAVAHAMTGTDALRMANEDVFSLVLLDIGLPDLTGLEVCSRLRRRSSVPILFLSARHEEIDRVLGLELGGDDYVTKPFSPREVVARVRAILRRTSHPALAQTNCPPDARPEAVLVHDPVSMRVMCHGTPLDLTAHEYRLLVALIDAPGRVLTRDQLLEKAWQDPGAVTDRTVDAHIKSLRSKLRATHSGAESLIETRRGLGYSLSTPST